MPARMQSLRDKLIKAGLVSEDQAKKVESEVVVKRAPLPPRPPREADARAAQERPARAEGGGRPGRDERGGRGRGGPAAGGRPGGGRGAERTAERPIPKLPLLPGSKAAQREESRKQLEQDRRVRELVTAMQVPLEEGATVFYFMTRKKKLRRLTLTEAQAGQLERGELAVVERPDPDKIEHALLPAVAADQLLSISARAVRFFNRQDCPIGFMTDDELRAQQQTEAEAEARGETGEEESAAAGELAGAEATVVTEPAGGETAQGGEPPLGT